MSRARKRVAWGVVLWSALLLVVAILLAGEAILSLDARQPACFFSYPAVPCPGAGDPAVARLTFAFFGIPVIWLAGITIAVAAWAVRRARQRDH